MDILNRMVAGKLSRGELHLVLEQKTVESLKYDCFEVLSRIREILADDNFEDLECFERIERIVCEMESLGIDCGGRHDFG